jgi:membrane protease YdiL (CAAX protease family)
LTATAFRWLLVPELGLGITGILWAVLSRTEDVGPASYAASPGLVLASIGLTVVFAAGNFGLFFAGRGQAFTRGVYEFLEGAIFPLVRQASLAELLLGAAMAGFSEELFFRGLLQPWIGLPAASLVFGLLHGPSRELWPLAVWATGAGALLGLVYSATENLLLPTLVHALYDAAALLYVRYRWRPQELPKEPSPS